MLQLFLAFMGPASCVGCSVPSSLFPASHDQPASLSPASPPHSPVLQYLSTLTASEWDELGCVYPFHPRSKKAQTLKSVVWV